MQLKLLLMTCIGILVISTCNAQKKKRIKFITTDAQKAFKNDSLPLKDLIVPSNHVSAVLGEIPNDAFAIGSGYNSATLEVR